MDFVPEELPEWRRTDLTTSAMIDHIADFFSRYEQLPEDRKTRARASYSETALAEFLFQVNKIEKEGFETYDQTVDAIAKGALDLVDPQQDSRLESLCSLYRALKHWWADDNDQSSGPSFCIEELEKCHTKLMSSTKGDIAGRIRSLENEIVFTNTEDGIHAFTWPTDVRPALEELFRKTRMALSEIQSLPRAFGRKRVEDLLKLGGCFFLEFENIHPFIDGNGRCGRILLAVLLRSLMPFPNVLFVDRPCSYGLPPYVTPIYYYDCFHKGQSPQKIEFSEDGQPVITRDVARCELKAPEHLTALIVEGVYVGWKRFFDSYKPKKGQVC